MPVIFQKIIKREDARRNLPVLYAFGDNVARVGLAGQARELRGEKNAVGIRTKYTPSEYYVEAAAEIIAQNRMIDLDMARLFEQVQRGGVVVWPTCGIGTGHARLPFCAPSTFEHLRRKLDALLEVADLRR